MSSYVGEVGKRIVVTATLVGKYEFSTFFGYREQEHTIYTFQDAEGNVYVWKTTSVMGIESVDEKGNWHFDGVHIRDKFTCKATVKEHSEYKGTPQTVLTRVKVTSIEHTQTKEEFIEKKSKEQLESLCDGDILWNMPYRQYKDHYADCETLAGSYAKPEYEPATITVIIREGRLVPSGVRGGHYSVYEFKNAKSQKVCYKAISEETAYRRVEKEYPNEGWDLVKIYGY